ncbi:MAG: alpha-N-arabinofuranosidase [Gemmatimonadota bacterium]
MRKLMKPLVFAMIVCAAKVQSQVITATIDGSAKGAPIQPLIYGMFVEHAGALLEQGFRAEMLDDRKFYFAVGQQPPAGGRGNRGGPRRTWQPLAADGSVTMDSAHAYASEHVPLVTLAGAEPRGIRQTGVAIRAGKEYTGRIVVAGDPSAVVSVSLVWGDGSAGRQTVRLAPPGGAWTTRTFRFSAPAANSDSARVEISGTGRGSFRVGAVSLMPADNVKGFRREIVTALATLHSGVYRFPGGNFVSGPFDWRDAIGDPDKRPPRWDPVWSALQPNDFGLDEFMDLCQLLDVQPYITVNAGFGDAWSAAQQVKYANGAVTTPMGRLRAANGHAKPYGIKYWGIGNEMWGDWQYGYMSVDQWISKQGQFARAMRKADRTITLIAPGAMPDAMTGSGMAKKLTGKVIAEEMGPSDFSAALLSRSIDDFEMLSQHFYVYGGTHYDLEQGKQVPDDPNIPLVDWARKPASMVRVEYEHYQTYMDKIPAMRRKHVPIALDEWAYSGTAPGSYKPVLAYAWGLNELFRHSDIFAMGGFTFAGSTLSASRTDAVLNPIGLMFALYSQHFGRIPLAVSGNSPQPERTGRVGAETPNVNAGSPTYPIDVAAALSEDGKMLTVSVVNPTESARQLQLDVRGLGVSGPGKVWRMAPPSTASANLVGREPQVRVGESSADASAVLTIPAISVGVYAFPVKK